MPRSATSLWIGHCFECLLGGRCQSLKKTPSEGMERLFYNRLSANRFGRSRALPSARGLRSGRAAALKNVGSGSGTIAALPLTVGTETGPAGFMDVYTNVSGC